MTYQSLMMGDAGYDLSFFHAFSSKTLKAYLEVLQEKKKENPTWIYLEVNRGQF